MPSIKTLVNASADIINIVSLSKGSVYKRVAKKGYQGDEVEVLIGVVTDILSSSDGSTITVVEFDSTYSTVEAKMRAFSGGTDILIHPASVTEVRTALDELLTKVSTQISTIERDLASKRAVFHQLDAVRRGDNIELLEPAVSIATTKETTNG